MGLGIESSAWEASIARLFRETDRHPLPHRRVWPRRYELTTAAGIAISPAAIAAPSARRPLPPDRAALRYLACASPVLRGQVCDPWRSRESDWTMCLAANPTRQRLLFVDEIEASVGIVLRRIEREMWTVYAKLSNPAN